MPPKRGRSIYCIDSVSDSDLSLSIRLTDILIARLVCDHPILLRKFVDKLSEGLDVAMMWLNEPLGKGDLLNSEAM